MIVLKRVCGAHLTLNSNAILSAKSQVLTVYLAFNSLQTKPAATLFFWYLHSLSSLILCARTRLVRDFFVLCCAVCLEHTMRITLLDVLCQTHSYGFYTRWYLLNHGGCMGREREGGGRERETETQTDRDREEDRH